MFYDELETADRRINVHAARASIHARMRAGFRMLEGSDDAITIPDFADPSLLGIDPLPIVKRRDKAADSDAARYRKSGWKNLTERDHIARAGQ